MSFNPKSYEIIHKQQSAADQENIEEPQQNIGEILHTWRAPEFEVYEKSARWYLIGAVFISLIVAYALYTNSPIMAITFILLGIIGFIYLQKDPRIVNFAVTTKGILADNQLYDFENIYSFWIFYEEPNIKIISLHTKASMLPYVHIPLHGEDPVKLREFIISYIPEIKQDISLIDTLERVLHI
ncbi:MAG: hypothetical protein US63_C0016G0004 [Candidatus Moranbacteria bacterium GW2011_GWC2_37_8]|nr:MAG: hypothetical protein US63_C0016G0004 [Candidatus Moranbacteria bacterium GW2011_GWC2_37_8]KKQ62485.1 MAG: hypothetical protein US82_C0010G0005 [Parcubacteria group bacterium GW2011_GWC1_38_22]